MAFTRSAGAGNACSQMLHFRQPRTLAPPAKTFTNYRALSTGAHHLTNERKTADLPLAVWPCAQRTSQWQRYERYLPESNRHPGKMLPALARRAVESYSDPGGLVLDPMCGIGTTLVEASSLGRRAFGIELESRWAQLAIGNLDHIHAEDGRARARAQVAEGDAGERRPAPRARHVGLDRSYVGAIERGEFNISLETIVKLAVALEMPAADLIEKAGFR
jgi:hypothetical protein